MKNAAGIIGLIFGVFSLLYVGVYGTVVGAGSSWLGSQLAIGDLRGWGQMVQVLSWLAPVLAIGGGALSFSNPRFGSATLALSAGCHWYLLGFTSIGNIFALPIGISAVLAFLSGFDLSGDSNHDDVSRDSMRHSHTTTGFDRPKWNALVQYDAEIAAAEKRIRPMGSKWVDELATSYLALNDRAYLPGIIDQITARAKIESERAKIESEKEEKLKVETRKLHLKNEREKERISERARQIRGERLRSFSNLLWGNRRRKSLMLIAAILVSVVAAEQIYEHVDWAVGTSGEMQLPQDAMFDFSLGRMSTDASKADLSIHYDRRPNPLTTYVQTLSNPEYSIIANGNIDTTLIPLNGAQIYKGNAENLGHRACASANFSNAPLFEQNAFVHHVCLKTRDGKIVELIPNDFWKRNSVTDETSNAVESSWQYVIWNLQTSSNSHLQFLTLE